MVRATGSARDLVTRETRSAGKMGLATCTRSNARRDSETSERMLNGSEVELVDIRLVEDERFAQHDLAAANIDRAQAPGLQRVFAHTALGE